MASNSVEENETCTYCHIQNCKRILTNLVCKAGWGEMEAMIGDDEYNSLDMAWDRFLSLPKPDQLELIKNKFYVLRYINRQCDHWRYMQSLMSQVKRTWVEPAAPKPFVPVEEPRYCSCDEGVYEVEQAKINQLDQENLDYDGMRVFCKWGEHCRVMCEDHRIRFHNLCIWGINCTRMKHDEAHCLTHHTSIYQDKRDKWFQSKISDMSIEIERKKAEILKSTDAAMRLVKLKQNCNLGDKCRESEENEVHRMVYHNNEYNPGTKCPCRKVNCIHQTYDLCCDPESCAGIKYHKGQCPHHDNEEDYDRFHLIKSPAQTSYDRFENKSPAQTNVSEDQEVDIESENSEDNYEEATQC